MKKIILYSVILVAAALTGCMDDRMQDDYTAPQDELVAIELVGLGDAVEVVSRAGIDASRTNISTATIIVFHGTEDRVLQRRTIDYPSDAKVYLKRGETFRVFAIANLTDANCPGDATAATYFDDVTSIADLAGKYYISSVDPGKAPDNLPMVSGPIGSALATVIIPSPLQTTAPRTDIIEIELRSLYTKVSVNINNLVTSSGVNLSGVELASYYANNVPAYSWIAERMAASPNPNGTDGVGAKDDYPQNLTPVSVGYQRSSLVDIRDGYNIVQIGDKYYQQLSFDVYCLENRRGTVAELNSTNVYDRKSKAPKFAFEINLQGSVHNALTGKDDVLQTYVVIGNGYDDATKTNVVYGDFNVERNSIYYVNVFINGVDNVEADSRRMYLNVVVCGDLESPENGGGYEF